MRTWTTWIGVAMAGALAACGGAATDGGDKGGRGDAQVPAEQTGRSFTVALTGAAEVPGPGDPDGSGTARVTITPGLGSVCFEIRVTKVSDATGAHIHVGEAGDSGGVAVFLAGAFTGTTSGCVSASASLLADIVSNPSGYYVNVHTTEFPDGALRGQLR